jgi:VWFA-related protein
VINHVRCGSLLCASFLSTALLCAQQSTAPGPAPASTINLDVVVTAKSGPPVGSLQQQNFTLFDNKSPRPIASFKASQDPVHVILVIDAVNTDYQIVAYERQQLDRFLHANGGSLSQPTTLVFFTDKGVEMEKTYTTNGNELSGSLDSYAIGLRDIRRSSQYQGVDRFQLSIKALGEIVASQENLPGRKMILWVSPGWPLLSGPGIVLDARQLDQAFSMIVGLSTQLRLAQATLYAISPLGSGEGVGRSNYYEDFLKGVKKPGDSTLGALSLQVLAAQSGGLVFYGSNDVSSLLQKCLEDARAYYVLSFVPPPADHRDEYHSLQIQVDKPGLTARTRQGYYAQP